MDAAFASIIVALIGTIGTVIVTVIQKLRKENKDDHATVHEALRDLHTDIKSVDQKLDNHIEWHLHKK